MATQLVPADGGEPGSPGRTGDTEEEVSRVGAESEDVGEAGVGESSISIPPQDVRNMSLACFGRMNSFEFRQSFESGSNPSTPRCGTPRGAARSELGPDSRKHATWGDSNAPTGALVPFLMLLLCLGIAVGLGAATGCVVNQKAWGYGSGAIIAVACYVLFMAGLIAYLIIYSNGLQSGRMARCVNCLGFVNNVRANLFCRYHLTCCYNGHCHIFGLVMNGEASNTLEQIKQLNDGEGPAPGGVCWLGDSELTFWHHLRDDLAAFHSNCFNAGFGGGRVIDMHQNLQRLCLDWQPETVIVHVGGNDFDVEPSLRADELPPRLLKLFEAILAHRSVKRVGYMLSSRRPCYSDWKWEFMVRVGELTIRFIENSHLRDKIFVLDLRSMVHPLADFVAADRQHLNQQGHRKKAEVLLPMLMQACAGGDLEEGIMEGEEEELSAPRSPGSEELSVRHRRESAECWCHSPELAAAEAAIMMGGMVGEGDAAGDGGAGGGDGAQSPQPGARP
eukprot:SAG25_NODE_408_length_8433_cov_5.830934_3_plen_505_part_00